MLILTDNMEVSTRLELVEVIRSIKTSIAEGALRQIHSADQSPMPVEFSAIDDEGPWPDFIAAEFVDSSGARYRLEVETYHGAGGTWRRL